MFLGDLKLLSGVPFTIGSGDSVEIKSESRPPAERSQRKRRCAFGVGSCSKFVNVCIVRSANQCVVLALCLDAAAAGRSRFLQFIFGGKSDATTVSCLH